MNAPTRFRIDWSQVLADLVREGYSITKISFFTSIPTANLYTYRDRDLPREPLHYRGEILKKFWCETTGRPADQIPVIPVAPRYVVRR